jgi:hypothetical protein
MNVLRSWSFRPFLSAASLQAFALSCEDAVHDGGVLAAITEVRLVANKSASIAAPT